MPGSKIDERSLVPVTWLFVGFGFVVSATIIGAFWVSTVNFRLERIEEKLGIPAYRSAFEIPFDPVYGADRESK